MRYERFKSLTVENPKNKSTDDGGCNHPQKRTPKPLPHTPTVQTRRSRMHHSNDRKNITKKNAGNQQRLRIGLILVALVVEHGKGDDKEDKNSISNIDSKPEGLHRKRKRASTVVDSVAAGLTVGDVGGEHEDGDSSDGEAKDDDDLGEVRLVNIIRVLVVDEEVEVDEQNENANDGGNYHQSEVEIPH